MYNTDMYLSNCTTSCTLVTVQHHACKYMYNGGREGVKYKCVRDQMLWHTSSISYGPVSKHVAYLSNNSSAVQKTSV